MTSFEQWRGVGTAAALAGAGLALYGLRRGTMAGLALAAAGGYLAYRGLRPADHPWARANVPPADTPTAERFLTEALGGGRP